MFSESFYVYFAVVNFKKHRKPMRKLMSESMKGVFKSFIYLLFELLVIPILIIYIPYFIYRKKYRAIKLMDNFYEILIKIENKF